jgi:SAM-dependent methyltransferase
MRRRLAKHRLVERGYDRIADASLGSEEANDPETGPPFEQFMEMLPAGASALDLGCGSGVPFTQRLAERFEVTGVDISARQLELARAHVPTAHFVKADMTTVEFPAGSFDAVVACFSIIHVPREEQGPLVARVCSWLRPGGLFLATWAVEAWEGAGEWEGATMWWSHYDPDTSLGLLRAAGFQIPSAEVEGKGEETWLWVLARKQ